MPNRGIARIEEVMHWGQGSPIRQAQLAAIALHSGEWSIHQLPAFFGIPEPERKNTGWDCFGYVIGNGAHWRIALHEAIAGALDTTTLAHEVGHTFQHHKRRVFCSPQGVMEADEQEAHVIACVFCVPLAAIERLDWRDTSTVRDLAQTYDVPPSYVHMRDAAAIFLKEKAGTERSGSWRLNVALQEHQKWMWHNAKYLQAREGAWFL